MRELLLRPPDVLLLDLIMPPPDGFEILERMRHSPGLAGIPVILLTATSYAEDNLRRGAGLITVRRPGGFSPAEALRHLKALADSLSSHGTVADFAPSADSAPLA